jgi:hypothetical protein
MGRLTEKVGRLVKSEGRLEKSGERLIELVDPDKVRID